MITNLSNSSLDMRGLKALDVDTCLINILTQTISSFTRTLPTSPSMTANSLFKFFIQICMLRVGYS
jgi:hypothetical protein